MSDDKLVKSGRAIVKRNMEVYNAGVAASGKGPKAVSQAMAKKYMEQRGGGVTNRTNYDYSLGGSKEGDAVYLRRK